MDAPRRLTRLLRVPAAARDAVWLDAVSDVHAALEEALAEAEWRLTRCSEVERVALHVPCQRLAQQLAAAEAAFEEALGSL